jgi:hypothetical protein
LQYNTVKSTGNKAVEEFRDKFREERRKKEEINVRRIDISASILH